MQYFYTRHCKCTFHTQTFTCLCTYFTILICLRWQLRARRFQADFFSGMIATRGRQSTKGKSQSVFACLRSLVNLAPPRIRQSDLPSIVYPSIATGNRRIFLSLRKRANDIATQRLLRGIRCSGSRVDRISLVIYSMRVGGISPSFAVILAAPLPQRYSAEGKDDARVKTRKRDKRTL